MNRVVTPPAREPLLLDALYQHLRLDVFGGYTEDDLWLEATTKAVRQWCEGYLESSIGPQLREWKVDCLSGMLEIPYGPVSAIESIAYVDEAGVSQLFVDYIADGGRVVPVTVWPRVRRQPGAVTIRYYAGYDLPGDSPQTWPLPEAVKSAMLLLIGHLYENRESTSATKLEEIPMGVASLLEPYRRRLSMA